ncbi:hypothetical protein MMC14_000595 [Varicellaria rhodocarpa]|nr:hypothetical protein [Varicellaria rhodocarpa]
MNEPARGCNDSCGAENRSETLTAGLGTDKLYDVSYSKTTKSSRHANPSTAHSITSAVLPGAALTAKNLSAHTFDTGLNQDTTPFVEQQSFDRLEKSLQSLGVELPVNIIYKMLPDYEYTPLYERVYAKNDVSMSTPTSKFYKDLESKTSDSVILGDK